MNDTRNDVTERSQVLVTVLLAFKVLEVKAKWFERLLIKMLRRTYRDRLRYLVGVLPPDASGEILKVLEG